MKRIDILEEVRNGARFSIDFKKRALKLNGKLVDIEWEPDDGIYYMEVMEGIEVLYHEYKHSVPSERSERRQRNYFRALPYEQLTTWDLCYMEPREEARFCLEFDVLENIVNGRLKWQPEWGSWFWQSDKDKDLVILREWVEPK